jgi:hypothetical protein
MKTKDIVLYLLFLIVGALLSFLFNKQLALESNKMRYFDVDIYQKAFFGQPTNINKKLEILLDGEPITNLIEVSIDLYNFTDRDYSKIPIYITLTKKNGDSLSLKMVQSEIYGQNNSIDKISELKNLKPVPTKGSLKFGYQINTANRSNEFDPVFKATYYLISNSEIITNTDIDILGLRTRKFDLGNLYPLKWYRKPWLIIIVVTLGYFFIMWIIPKIMKKLFKKRIAKIQEKRFLYVFENMDDSLINLDDKAEMIKEINYLSSMFFWLRTSLWSRKLFNYEKPKKE